MNNIQKSMRDIAFELLSKKTKPVAFNKLWKEVSEILGLSEEETSNKIGTFYTHITLDGRFVLLENNTWDLRSRHTSDKIIKVVDEDDDDEIEEIKEEDDENLTDSFDSIENDEDDIDDSDDDLKDLVVLDEDELELEQ